MQISSFYSNLMNYFSIYIYYKLSPSFNKKVMRIQGYCICMTINVCECLKSKVQTKKQIPAKITDQKSSKE